MDFYGDAHLAHMGTSMSSVMRSPSLPTFLIGFLSLSKILDNQVLNIRLTGLACMTALAHTHVTYLII